MAFRYLTGAEGRAEGQSFLRFITYVAIGGVALGVGALLLALMIVRGFSQEIESKIIGFGAHIQVHSFLQEEGLEAAPDKQQRLLAMEGVRRAAPVVEDFALLRRSSSAIDGVIVLGTDALPPYLEGRTVAGSFQLAAGTEHPSLVVGQSLADRLDLTVGSTVTAFSLRRSSAQQDLQIRRPRVEQFRVAGIYETSLTLLDDVYVFTDIGTARSLLGVPETSVSHFDVTVDDTARIDSIAARIESTFEFPVAARTIFEQFAGLFAWVNLQEGIVPLVIGVIVIVAAFNIVGTLLMMILEKTREIGVLMSLGASSQLVRRMFLALGTLIGIVGTALGAGLAFALGRIQQTFHLIPLPAEAYYMKTAPIELNPGDFVLVCAVSILLCALAAYIPARVAARIEPVRSIRFQ
jgi:lipoprotein-releasing system permease protein